MPYILKTLGVAVAWLAAIASAAPAVPRLTEAQLKIHEVFRRQNALAQAAGLTDFDILQFALTLELLESAFYSQGFAKFPASDFQALGLSAQQVQDLVKIGESEQAHVILLQGALAQGGIQPVQECQYNFGFTDAKGMLATAAVLENVGVSAYLGAAKLVTDPNILTTAGSILTVEARHQTLARVVTGSVAVPTAFDAPLSPKQVFSLAAPFITSCNQGSNLILTAFPTLTMAQGASSVGLQAGSVLQLQSSASAQATFCAFTAGGVTPGGTTFSQFSNGQCLLPQGLSGLVYVTLASAGPLTGILTDDIILAGPMVMQVS